MRTSSVVCSSLRQGRPPYRWPCSGGRGKAPCRPRGGSQDTAEIRAWAKENGYEVNDRGRVPAPIREAYEKANG